MNTIRKIHIAIAIFLIILASTAITIANSFPKLDISTVGPAFFPVGVAGLLILLAIILSFSSTNGDESEEPQTNASWKMPLLGIAATTVYVFLTYLLGFYLSTVIFLVIIMPLLKFRGVFKIIFVTGLVVFLIYGVFEVLLKVPMPTGGLF